MKSPAWCGVFKTEGVTLKTSLLGEADLLLTIYTKGYGKISARAVSARKKDSKLKGYLQPFCHGQFYLAKSKTIDIVTDVQVIDPFSCLHSDLKSLAYAFYFAELCDKMIFGPERDENLWRLVLRGFQALDEGKASPAVRDAFENKLLDFLGHPRLSVRGKISFLQKLNYFQSLAGQHLYSHKFLSQIN